MCVAKMEEIPPFPYILILFISRLRMCEDYDGREQIPDLKILNSNRLCLLSIM